MNGHDCVNGFDFDNDRLFEDEIDSIRRRDVDPCVANRQRDLAAKLQAASLEFMTDGLLVCAFEQSRTKRGVHCHPRADDAIADFVRTHLFALSSPPCPWLQSQYPSSAPPRTS